MVEAMNCKRWGTIYPGRAADAIMQAVEEDRAELVEALRDATGMDDDEINSTGLAPLIEELARARDEQAEKAGQERDRWRQIWETDTWSSRADKAEARVAALVDALRHIKAHAHMAPETERIIDAALAGVKGETERICPNCGCPERVAFYENSCWCGVEIQAQPKGETK